MSVLCIDVGGTYIKYTVLDERLNFDMVQKQPTPKDNLEHFLNVIDKIYAQNRDVEGITISTPGILDQTTGYMKNGGSLPYIQELPLAKIVSERCDGMTVKIENDAKAAATAEIESGILKNCRNAVVLTIGTAVGGTVIVDGRILRGAHLFAGEMSYATYDIEKRTPGVTGAPMFWGLYGIPSRICGTYADPGLSSEEIIRRMQNGDTSAEVAVRTAAYELALLIHNLQCIFDPEMIALGGGISEQNDFVRMVREESTDLNRMIGHDVPLPRIETCMQHNNANLLGAYYAFRRAKG